MTTCQDQYDAAENAKSCAFCDDEPTQVTWVHDELTPLCDLHLMRATFEETGGML